MAVMISKDKRKLFVDCRCGCGDSVKMKINSEDNGEFFFETKYCTSEWHNQQQSGWTRFVEKCKKIWRIIRNEDFYYSDIWMSKEEFQQFKDYVNQFADGGE